MHPMSKPYHYRRQRGLKSRTAEQLSNSRKRGKTSEREREWRKLSRCSPPPFSLLLSPIPPCSSMFFSTVVSYASSFTLMSLLLLLLLQSRRIAESQNRSVIRHRVLASVSSSSSQVFSFLLFMTHPLFHPPSRVYLSSFSPTFFLLHISLTWKRTRKTRYRRRSDYRWCTLGISIPYASGCSFPSLSLVSVTKILVHTTRKRKMMHEENDTRRWRTCNVVLVIQTWIKRKKGETDFQEPKPEGLFSLKRSKERSQDQNLICKTCVTATPILQCVLAFKGTPPLFFSLSVFFPGFDQTLIERHDSMTKSVVMIYVQCILKITINACVSQGEAYEKIPSSVCIHCVIRPFLSHPDGMMLFYTFQGERFWISERVPFTVW